MAPDVPIGRRAVLSHAYTRNPVAALAQFCSLLGLLWCALFGLAATFPYVRSGADAVRAAKLQDLDRGIDADVVIFGDSKVLSGFEPALFDSFVGTRSFNLGLPAQRAFVDNVEKLSDRSPSTRVVLLTLTDTVRRQGVSLFHYLNDDRLVADSLFPFRHFPRDLATFLLMARHRGGAGAYYRERADIIARMEADRGYYFIDGRTYFPAGELPQDFHLTTDQAHKVNARPALAVDDLSRLRRIADRHKLEIWFVPTYYRVGEYAPAPDESVDLAQALRGDARVHVIGPDYWCLSNDLFSDLVHLNPRGAAVYSRKLGQLLGSRRH